MTRLVLASRAFWAALRTGTNPNAAALTRHLDAHAAHVLGTDRYADAYEAGQNDAFDAMEADLPNVIHAALIAHGITPRGGPSEYNDHMAAQVAVAHAPLGQRHLSLVGGTR